MSDRFDLEEQILRTSEYANQLKDLAEFMINNEGMYEPDRIHNALIGISQMIDIHTDKMYNTMCDALELNQKSSNPPLTNADTPVRTSCKGECGRVHQSYGFPMD